MNENKKIMGKQIDDILSKRTEYLLLLDKDIERNEMIRDRIQKEVKSLEDTRQNIQEIGKVPEHTAIIPLCKKLYIPASIVHTGEYLIKKTAHPNSYFILKTFDQTFSDLDNRIEEQKKLLVKAEAAIPQLEERKKLLLGEFDEDSLIEQQLVDDEEYGISSEVETMPQEIKSDKGVAVKVGGFYEIFEYEQ